VEPCEREFNVGGKQNKDLTGSAGCLQSGRYTQKIDPRASCRAGFLFERVATRFLRQ